MKNLWFYRLAICRFYKLFHVHTFLSQWMQKTETISLAKNKKLLNGKVGAEKSDVATSQLEMRAMESYCALPFLEVNFVRTPHIILEPQMDKIYILRSTSDLTLYSSVW